MSTIFSKIAAGEIPSYKCAEDERFYAFLDINPVVKAHTLVVPREEVDYIFDMDDESLAAFEVFAKKVARAIRIPFAVGGGIANLADMSRVLLAGAEKVSVNSLAVRQPQIIAEGARAFGAQCIVLGMDALRVEKSAAIPSGYEVVVKGGRERTGLDALAWAREAERLGAGEICLNSIDADGTREGYELPLTSLIAGAVGIPVIASGGAGSPEHLRAVLTEGKADAALVASIVHLGQYPVPEIKRYLASHGVRVRP